MCSVPKLGYVRVRAQIFGGRVTTYAELDRHASRVANGLIALGAAPQARIGYLGKNSDLYFELLLGALKANLDSSQRLPGNSFGRSKNPNQLSRARTSNYKSLTRNHAAVL
jgi:hypothetical protein